MVPPCVEGHLPIQKEYSRSVFVLTVDVVSSQAMPDSRDKYFLSGTNYTLRPVEILKGHPPATISVFSENSVGRFDMERGQTYFVFIYSDHGRLQIDNCGNSGRLDTSEKTVATVRELRNSSK